MLSFILLTSTLVQPVTKCGHGVQHQHPPTTMESLHKVVSCNTENSLEQTFFCPIHYAGIWCPLEHRSNYSSGHSERKTESERKGDRERKREVARQLPQIKLSTDDQDQLDTVNKFQFSNSKLERRAPYIQ